MYLLPPLVITLSLPSPSVAVAAASLTSAVVVVVIVVVLVVFHPAPILPVLRASLLASATRRARRRVVTPLTLATVDPEEVDVASRNLQLRLRHSSAFLTVTITIQSHCT